MPDSSKENPAKSILEARADKFSVRFVEGTTGLTAEFHGMISSKDPAGVLNPLIDKIHRHALRAKQTSINVDLRALDFCNSSGFKSLVYWIQAIQSTPSEQRYKLIFLSNPDRKWQRTSLLALSCYGLSAIEISGN